MRKGPERNGDGSPRCYGGILKKAGCGKCAFAESCLFYETHPLPDDQAARSTSGHGVSYEKCQYSAKVAAPAHDGEDGGFFRDSFTAAEMIAVLQFILREVDAYSLEIAVKAIRAGENATARQLADAMGVSKQAINIKLLAIARKHPQLAYMLEGCLRRVTSLVNGRGSATLRIRSAPKMAQDARRIGKRQLELLMP